MTSPTRKAAKLPETNRGNPAVKPPPSPVLPDHVRPGDCFVYLDREGKPAKPMTEKELAAWKAARRVSAATAWLRMSNRLCELLAEAPVNTKKNRRK